MKGIPLTQGFTAYVDDEDYDELMKFKWHASIESRGTKVYAVRRATKAEIVAFGLIYWPGRRVKIRMHRQVLGLKPLPGPLDLVVDHKNGDSLDNRKENLQKVTQEENMRAVETWKRRVAPSL